MADYTSDAFTLKGFETPEEIRRRIGRATQQDASAFGLQFGQGIKNNRNRILAQIGASFGYGMGSSMNPDPAIAQAEKRQKILSGVDWNDPEDLGRRAEAAAAIKDPQLNLFLSDRKQTIEGLKAKADAEKRKEDRDIKAAEIAREREDRLKAAQISQEEFNLKKLELDQKKFELQKTGQDWKQDPEVRKLQLENLRESINLRKTLQGYYSVGKAPKNAPAPSLSELARAKQYLTKDPRYAMDAGLLNTGFGKESLDVLVPYLAEEAKAATVDGKPFSFHFDRIYNELVKEGIITPDAGFLGKPSVDAEALSNRGAVNPYTVAPPGAGNPFIQPNAAQDIQTPGGPAVGDVVDGYEFLGGNPGDPKNWKKK